MRCLRSQAPVDLLLSAQVQSSTAQAPASDLVMSLSCSACIKRCKAGLMLPSPLRPLDVQVRGGQVAPDSEG